jgi:hypothetical protein
MALTDDPTAVDVAGDEAYLLANGAVRFRGYVKLATAIVPTLVAHPGAASTIDPVPVQTLRIYLNSSFDYWLEVERDKVRSQMPHRPEDEGRSLVWVDANAIMTRCRSSLAGTTAQELALGSDNPTGYPPTSHP